MKRILFPAIILAMTSSLTPSQTIVQRQQQQQARILQGIRSGSLTAREAARLERGQARIGREIRRDRADGAGMTVRERAKAHRMLDRASRDISRLKHNPRSR
ncbi:MAG: hypothetical protein ACUVS7_02185 [Bryobacteraceae bacterium]